MGSEIIQGTTEGRVWDFAVVVMKIKMKMKMIDLIIKTLYYLSIPFYIFSLIPQSLLFKNP